MLPLIILIKCTVLEVYIFQNEQYRKNVHCDCDVLELSAEHVDYYVTDHSKKDTM